MLFSDPLVTVLLPADMMIDVMLHVLLYFGLTALTSLFRMKTAGRKRREIGDWRRWQMMRCTGYTTVQSTDFGYAISIYVNRFLPAMTLSTEMKYSERMIHLLLHHTSINVRCMRIDFCILSHFLGPGNDSLDGWSRYLCWCEDMSFNARRGMRLREIRS